MKQQKEESIETFRERLLVQKKKILTGAIVFFALILLVTGFYLYNLKKQSDAKELETEAYRYYFGVIKDSNLSQQQRFIKSAQLFIEAYNKKKNPTYLLNAGYAYDMAGQKDKAIDTLNKVSGSSDTNLSNLAKVRIAIIYLKNNEQQQAIKKLDEIVNGQSLVMKDFALFQLAKIYEKDKKQEALKYYERLVKDFPQSPFSEIARKFLESDKKQ
ncbi:MAG: tetratricopeptide repeat protein [Thermodesulfovibrio sp.]|nr:tetratricopeptide repeat protein [Thermodesulfovibrio sp.]